jgi:alpha-L-fucosidase
MPPLGGIGEEDPDLAVAHLTQGARVLPGNAHRLLALLRKAGLIDQKRPVCRGESLAYPSRVSGQYAPDWESLDRRPNPQWWDDAKFGIFIHWGVYSVPAFSKVGEYSEWYWHALRSGKPDYVAFHNRVYGDDFTYADFVPLFRAEFFDSNQWASLFKRSGAKYVVLTSKHHDGYTLWPSQHADQAWGRAWNSVETGPQRDLVEDLSKAVRDAGLKMGLYYSLYEWFNPLYKTDANLLVQKHYIPQFKDVVTRYKPAVIFADGEWEHPSKAWKSEEVLAWLFNESPVKDEVVVNDRWGKETRHKHGGYFTTEYGSGLPNATHPCPGKKTGGWPTRTGTVERRALPTTTRRSN